MLLQPTCCQPTTSVYFLAFPGLAAQGAGPAEDYGVRANAAEVSTKQLKVCDFPHIKVCTMLSLMGMSGSQAAAQVHAWCDKQ